MYEHAKLNIKNVFNDFSLKKLIKIQVLKQHLAHTTAHTTHSHPNSHNFHLEYNCF